MNNLKSNNYIIRITVLILVLSVPVFSGEKVSFIPLMKDWIFQIGDSMQFSEPGYSDSHWDPIQVPGNWEDLGFPGYDGYAWYRLPVTLNKNLADYRLILDLGRIDDVDETYFNGHLLERSGTFPPRFHSATAVYRNYMIPRQWVRFDTVNIISVRVFDDTGSGGILSGKIGLWTEYFPVSCFMDLSGPWRFSPRASTDAFNLHQENSDWKHIDVPGRWELFGFISETGYAWYQRSFVIPEDKHDQHLVLVLGLILGLDDVYINGVRIGGLMPWNFETADFNENNKNWKIRFYTIPASLLNKNSENSIAVRIFDPTGTGGILGDPVGLMTQENYIKLYHK